MPLVAGVGEESTTTTVTPITEIDPISLTQYPAVRTPQHPPARDGSRDHGGRPPIIQPKYMLGMAKAHAEHRRKKAKRNTFSGRR